MSTKINRIPAKKILLLSGLLVCMTVAATSVLAATNQEGQSMTIPEKKEVSLDPTVTTDDVTQAEATQTPNPEVSDNSDTGEPVAEATAAAQSVKPSASVEAASQAGARAGAKKAIVTPQPATMIQVDDSFTGTHLNESLWEVISYPKGYRNNEEQDYRPSQVKVADGKLQITAVRDENGEWHSGEVHSKWAYRYGEFEVRLAVSTTGSGVWPAAWLMGSTDHWPGNGEIDIFENINGSSTVHGTIHGGGVNGHWQIQRSFVGVDVTQYHTYKLVKQPGVMSWWVDGVKRGEWKRAETPVGAVWPFEEYSYFGLLNLAIGGTWPGPSDATTPDVVHLYIDSYTVKNAS